MRFAYADPPYPGCARRYPEKQEVDHAELIAMLCRDFPDGWALSTHVPGLRMIWPMCPEDVRVCAWVKSYATWKPGIWPSYAWEPLILRGGHGADRMKDTPQDWMLCHATGSPGDVLGSKPVRFCWWLFALLGAQPGDELVDLFPGTGGVTRAWDIYLRQLSLFSAGPAPAPAADGPPCSGDARQNAD